MRLRILAAVCLAASVAQPSAQSPQTASATAFVGATLVDGTGGTPIENSVVVVRNGRVAEAGPSARVRVPDGAVRIDLRGKTLLPGFVNAHGHVADTSGLESGDQFYTRDNLERQLKLYARYGVTSVFSLGGDGPAGIALRNEPARDRARLFVAGPVISASTAAEAAAQVDMVASMGVDLLKIRIDDNFGVNPKMPPEAWKTVIQRGHQHGLRTAVHLYYLDDAKAVLREGADFIAHSVRDQPIDDEFIRLVKDRDVCVSPTLMREVSTFVYESTPEFFADPFFLRHADTAAVDQLKAPARQQQVRNGRNNARNKAALEQASRNLKRMKDAGVRIAMGTDTGPPARFQGYFEHAELEMMVKAGLTPMQAIVAATSDAAHCMRQMGNLGAIRPGAWADLAVYGASPVTDIRNTHTLESVWIGGLQVK
jgi:imidazolonepropionase-like amidohydrolase